MNFLIIFCTFNRRILPYTTRRTCANFFANVDHTDCEIIMFEVERIFFSLVSGRDNIVWLPLVQNMNYANLRFCTISMHIMLGSCVPNLRGRGWVEHTQMHLVLNKGIKKFHYISNSWGFFSEFTFSLDKNPNGSYEGPSVFYFKQKIDKKWNFQVSWGMEDFTLPVVGARFKKWECHTTILPKCQAHLQTSL
jgi:hypothetical protein